MSNFASTSIVYFHAMQRRLVSISAGVAPAAIYFGVLLTYAAPGGLALDINVGKTRINEITSQLGQPTAQVLFADGAVLARWPNDVFRGTTLRGDAVKTVVTYNDCDFAPDGVLQRIRTVSGATPFEVSLAASRVGHQLRPDCGGDAFAHTLLNALVASPDGKLLGSSGGDPGETVGHWRAGLTKIWSFPTGALLSVLDVQAFALAFTPDGAFLATAGGAIKLWHMPDGGLMKTLSGHKSAVLSLAISPDGKLLASGSNNRVALPAPPEPKRSKKSRRGTPPQESYSDDNGEIRLWSLPDGTPIKTLVAHETYSTHSLAITPDGRLLVSGSSDGRIRIWSLPDAVLLKTIDAQVPSFGQDHLAISADGKYVISENPLTLWSLPDGGLYKVIDAQHTGLLGNHLAVSADGKLLVANHDKITAWSLPDDVQLFRRQLPGANAIAMSTADGKLAAVAVNSRASDKMGTTIRIWSLVDDAFKACLY